MWILSIFLASFFGSKMSRYPQVVYYCYKALHFEHDGELKTSFSYAVIITNRLYSENNKKLPSLTISWNMKLSKHKKWGFRFYCLSELMSRDFEIGSCHQHSFFICNSECIWGLILISKQYYKKEKLWKKMEVC